MYVGCMIYGCWVCVVGGPRYLSPSLFHGPGFQTPGLPVGDDAEVGADDGNDLRDGFVREIFEVFALNAVRALAVKIAVRRITVNLTRHSLLSQRLAFSEYGRLAFLGPILESIG